MKEKIQNNVDGVVKLKPEEIELLQKYAKKLDKEDASKEQQSDKAVLDLKNTDEDDFKRTYFEKSHEPIVDLKLSKLKEDDKNIKTTNEIFGNKFHDEYLQIMGEYSGDAGREIMLQNLLTRIDQEGELSDGESELKLKILNKLDDIEDEKEKISDNLAVEEKDDDKEEYNVELTDEIKNIETTDIQSDRIKVELEELRNSKKEISDDEKKSKGAKIRECRRINKNIDELEGKSKYFETEKDDEIIELTDEVVESQEDGVIELEKENPKLEKMAKEAVEEGYEIPADVLKKFEDEFGVKEEDLKSKEIGLNGLTNGQQLLVLENLRQWLLGEIQVKSIKDFEQKKQKFKDKGKVRSLFHSARLNLAKGLRIKKFEKINKDNIKQDENKKNIKQVLNNLVSQIKISGTQVEVVETDNGEKDIEIQYLSANQSKELDKTAVQKFNQAATAFSKMPAIWGSESYKVSSKKEYKKYNQVKKEYEETKARILTTLDAKNLHAIESDPNNKKAEKYDMEKAAMGEALKEMNEMNMNVQMDKFLNTHPEVEEALLNIDKPVYKQVLGAFIKSEKGVAFASGVLSRVVSRTALAFGSVTAATVTIPVTLVGAAGFGAWRGRIRGKEDIKNKEHELGRESISEKGVKKAERKKSLNELTKLEKEITLTKNKQGEEYINKQGRIAELKTFLNTDSKITKERNFVNAESLMNKMDILIDKINNPDNKDQKDKLIKSLKTRINYTRRKVESGLVNFGDGDEIINNTYNLTSKLSGALSHVGEYEEEQGSGKIQNKEKLQERIDKILDARSLKITEKQKKYLNKKLREGIYFGVGFAGVGMGVARYFNEEIDQYIAKPIKGAYDKVGDFFADKKIDIEPDFSKADKATLKVLGNLSDVDKEYIAKHGLHDYNTKEALKAMPLEQKGTVEEVPLQTGKSVKPSEPDTEIKGTEKSAEKIKTGNDQAKAMDASEPTEITSIEHGIKDNFKIKLGENEVPARLERTMYAFAMNAMDEKEMYTEIKGGVKLFDEEPAARSLNVAANLTKMAEGELSRIKGVDINDEMRNSFSFNKETGQLEIKNYAEFNKLVEGLHEHAKDLWDNKILEKEAVGYLDRIDKGAWQDIIEANGLEGQVDGHDDLGLEVKNFNDSEMVQKAEKVIRAREAKGSADLEKAKLTKVEVPQGLSAEKNVSESLKKTLKIFDVSGLKNINEIYETAGVDPEDGLNSGEIERLEFLAQNKDLIGRGEEFNKTFEFIERMDSKEAVEFIKKYSNADNIDNITEIYDQMPESIRDNGKQSLNYLMLKAGDGEEKAMALQDIFNLKGKPLLDTPYGFTQDPKTKMFTLPNVNGKEGTNILIDLKNNKICVYEIGMFGKSFGAERKFLGFGKAEPTADLTMENLKGVKEFLGVRDDNLVEKNVEYKDHTTGAKINYKDRTGT